jgi:PBP1b-binding outer membrane lipoprotein LpoB
MRKAYSAAAILLLLSVGCSQPETPAADHSLTIVSTEPIEFTNLLVYSPSIVLDE